MTAGDSPLRAARLRMGWSQSAAMRRFHSTAAQLGAQPPAWPSLKRMNAYWEAGEREVGVPAYRDAFCAIYNASPAELGFTETGLDDEGEEGRHLQLEAVDAGVVQVLADETQHLRVLDRRIGSATRAALLDAHADLVADLLGRAIGPQRRELAAVAGEAASLAGWSALDRGDLAAAWSRHQLARAAALESGALRLQAFVVAQQSVILADAAKITAARDEAAAAVALVGHGAPHVLRSWLAMNHATALAGNGEAAAARAEMTRAQSLLTDDADDLPYVMLPPMHLARWIGHCLTVLGDPAAIATLEEARAADGDSIRAAIGLHTDLAIALAASGKQDAADEEGARALALAERGGSVRQRKRLRLIQIPRAAG